MHTHIGKPLGEPVGNPELTIFTRQYEGCGVKLDCANTTKDGCVATLHLASIAPSVGIAIGA